VTPWQSATWLALLLAVACTDRGGRASAIAEAGEMEPRLIEAGEFTLAAWQRDGTPQDGVLTVYLEGDGRSWLNRGRLAADPTPTDPLGLRLAAADPLPAILYLARPCQYVVGAAARHCEPGYWSNARLAPEVVAATSTAIDRIEAESGARSVELIGYSGGGALAALVAARRADVRRLVTVAADLDLAAWARLHEVSPLDGSLDPAAVAPALAATPQLHFAGGADEIVPPAILESFRARLGAATSARFVTIATYDHECCWAADWPHLVGEARRLVGAAPP
jgi:pimeloyl-ACP methyl ester carboxylesterase